MICYVRFPLALPQTLCYVPFSLYRLSFQRKLRKVSAKSSYAAHLLRGVERVAGSGNGVVVEGGRPVNPSFEQSSL